MTTLRNFIILLALVLILSGCSSPTVEDYQATTPRLQLDQFFDGELKAYGLVLGRNGELKRRFSATISSSWQGNLGTLDEHFWFDDGEQQHRVWQIEKTADNHYQGRANDVVGVAQGKTTGSAMFWQYQLTITVDGEPLTVTIDDWLYLLDQQRLINNSDIRKFGIKVGELILFIEKLP